MKNVIDNLAETQSLIFKISEYDSVGMSTFISMLIDIAAAKDHITTDEKLEEICLAVKDVNEALGPISIIRVLASPARALERQIHGDNAGCTLLPEECKALHNFIRDEVDCSKTIEKYGTESLYDLLSAWEKIRKGRDLND